MPLFRSHPLALVTWAVFVAALVAGAVAAPDEAAVRGALEALGPAAPVAFLVAEAVQVVVIPIPGQPIEIPGGYLFGLVPGIILASTGALVGSLVAFGLGRRYGRPWVEARVAPETRRRFEGWLETGDRLEWIVFWLMLIPAFPRDPLCYLAGVTGMSARRFALIAAVGRPVGLVPWVALGAEGVASGLTFQLWLLAGAGAAWIVYRGTLRLARRRRAPQNLPPDGRT